MLCALGAARNAAHVYRKCSPLVVVVVVGCVGCFCVVALGAAHDAAHFYSTLPLGRWWGGGLCPNSLPYAIETAHNSAPHRTPVGGRAGHTQKKNRVCIIIKTKHANSNQNRSDQTKSNQIKSNQTKSKTRYQLNSYQRNSNEM